MGYVVDDEQKKVYADVRTATKKEMEKINACLEQGYELVSDVPGEIKTKPMPLNMGIHADSRLV